MTRKTRSPLINLALEIYDLIDDFWLLGAMLSVAFAVVTALVAVWAFNPPPIGSGNAITQLLAPLVYVRCLAIVGPGIVMVVFTMKTYRSWSRHRC
ncbi:hypothetical protein HYN96_20020 [Vibrio parahaemolyticus]|nr:hypothetical protein [Vibrio parahaemolyticus]